MRDPSKIDRHTAILSLVGGNLKTSGENHEKVFYLDGQTPPSDEEIDAEIIRLQAEYDALAWKRSREENYPSIQELVVALYDTDDKADIEAKRQKVKADYPKP
jgi:hypothetical protein